MKKEHAHSLICVIGTNFILRIFFFRVWSLKFEAWSKCEYMRCWLLLLLLLFFVHFQSKQSRIATSEFFALCFVYALNSCCCFVRGIFIVQCLPTSRPMPRGHVTCKFFLFIVVIRRNGNFYWVKQHFPCIIWIW